MDDKIAALKQKHDKDKEELRAQYGFVWSDDPEKAKPFISMATSPYNIGNCCIENDIHAPSAYQAGLEVVE